MSDTTSAPRANGVVTPRGNEDKKKIKIWQQVVASSSGAVLTSLFMTPLDVVKIRLQVQAKPMASGERECVTVLDFVQQQGDCFIYCNGLMDHVCTCFNNNTKPWYKSPGHFNGTVDAMVKITRNEGLARLWSGLPPTLVMAVPATALYYTTYDQLRVYFTETFSHRNRHFAPMVAGSLSRVFAVSIINPLELIRTKMQSKPLSYTQLVRCVQDAVEVDGIRSLLRGLGPTLLRDVPFSGVHWFLYNLFHTNLCSYLGKQEATFFTSFVCGATSGSIASLLTQPFDVVKTQRQVEIGEKAVMRNSNETIHRSVDILSNIYRKRGLNGLYAGLLPRIAKAAPACAIMISTYEYGKKFFSEIPST